MVNFENLDKFMFPGVGQYNIPQLDPVKIWPQGEFIPINYHYTAKDPASKIIHFLWTITSLYAIGTRRISTSPNCRSLRPCAPLIFPHTRICLWPCRYTTVIANIGLPPIGKCVALQSIPLYRGAMRIAMIGALMESRPVGSLRYHQ